MTGPITIDALPRTAESHFRLHIYGAVLHLRARLPEPDDDNGLGFLLGYYEALDAAGFATPGPQADARWRAAVQKWEASAPGHLPLRALRQSSGLDDLALTLLFTAGLVEEDLRFGMLFEALCGVPGDQRPTFGLLGSWSADGHAREALGALLELGLLNATEPDAPRPRQGLQVPAILWDAIRGANPAAAWVRHRPAPQLPHLHDLVLGERDRQTLARVPALIARSPSRTVIIRGPQSSGRRTLLAAIARAGGRGLLEVSDPSIPLAGPLATLLGAMAVIELDLAPGEVTQLPAWTAAGGPAGVIAGRTGGIRTAGSTVTLTTEIPGADLREALWTRALGDAAGARTLASNFRIPSGTIITAAELVRTQAALAGRDVPAVGDVAGAMRTMHDGLETLARRVPVVGDWGDLAVGDETHRELELLETRCRLREPLLGAVSDALSNQLNAGVRVLLSGPSGTGKTLAARLLASVLGKELYALDLSAVVNKYLGETEKNLEAVFARAEQLDVILLLDEGDALLTRRTDVQTSNDRYANLETNFLLQRLETYEGILLITSNAADRIDPAFKRRLDVVVEFRAPDPFERWQIWQLHLPPGHVVGGSLLEDVSARCALSGGQIRNAALHAALLALQDGAEVGDAQLDQAVRREYRKAGLVCPLRAPEVIDG